MGIVLTDYLTQLFRCFGTCVVWSQSPNHTASPVDDADDVGGTGAEYHVVRMKAFVPVVKPLVGSHIGQGIDMQPIGTLATFTPLHRAMNGFARPL